MDTDFFCVLSHCGGIFVETPNLGVSTGLHFLAYFILSNGLRSEPRIEGRFSRLL